MQLSRHRNAHPESGKSTIVEIFQRLRQSWATRSLAVGPVATVVDLIVLLACVKVFQSSTRVGAMLGVLAGSVVTFFGNRHFAFRDHDPTLAPQALKFVGTTLLAMVVHGQLVVMLRDYWNVPIVISKILADLLVFSIGQLLMLRYIVFRRKRHESGPVDPTPKAARRQPELGSIRQ
jgi:putative flippase GtrA